MRPRLVRPEGNDLLTEVHRRLQDVLRLPLPLIENRDLDLVIRHNEDLLRELVLHLHLVLSALLLDVREGKLLDGVAHLVVVFHDPVYGD